MSFTSIMSLSPIVSLIRIMPITSVTIGISEITSAKRYKNNY